MCTLTPLTLLTSDKDTSQTLQRTGLYVSVRLMVRSTECFQEFYYFWCHPVSEFGLHVTQLCSIHNFWNNFCSGFPMDYKKNNLHNITIIIPKVQQSYSFFYTIPKTVKIFSIL